MRIVLLPLVFTLFIASGYAQAQYRTTLEKPVDRYRTVDLQSAQQNDAFIHYLEYPKPGGEAYHDFLNEQKQKQLKRFGVEPAHPGSSSSRVAVDPPDLLNNFSANAWTAGIPLDNHLAVNNDHQIVSVVNTHMLVVGPTGVWQEWFSLDDFWTELGETDRYFDPRVIYDPQEDRFIMTMMQDGDCQGSNIVFAFSATSDPTGMWHLYQFEGCPNNDATFADYPMISLTDDELFYTYNAVYQDSTWQTGFAQTFIYQINKHDGYAGDPLTWRSWEDINHDGVLLRYIHPVKSATANLSTEMYFLSTRSFDLTNDTVFLAHINGNMDDPDLRLEVLPMIADVPYGVPPNAEQPQDFLQTNDARVLDAFYVNDHIQFVSNTMDPATGRCAVYHGMVTDVAFAPKLQASIIPGETEHYGYPGIAYTGLFAEDRDAIIVASHASADRFPGYSATYYNAGYSDWITVKEGLRIIDMIKVDNGFGADPTLERWGDYSGIQPVYNEEGTVYSVSSYGKPGNVNDSWIGYLSRPGIKSSTGRAPNQTAQLSVFPNPTTDNITMEVAMSAPGQMIESRLKTLQGSDLGSVYRAISSTEGRAVFHYNTSGLVPGTYLIQVYVDGRNVASKKFVVL